MGCQEPVSWHHCRTRPLGRWTSTCAPGVNSGSGSSTPSSTKVAIPRGALVVNARGLHVYPGLIDGGSVLGLSEISSVSESVDSSDS